MPRDPQKHSQDEAEWAVPVPRLALRLPRHAREEGQRDSGEQESGQPYDPSDDSIESAQPTDLE